MLMEEITVDESFMKAELESSLDLFEQMRADLGRGNKPRCLILWTRVALVAGLNPTSHDTS